MQRRAADYRQRQRYEKFYCFIKHRLSPPVKFEASLAYFSEILLIEIGGKEFFIFI